MKDKIGEVEKVFFFSLLRDEIGLWIFLFTFFLERNGLWLGTNDSERKSGCVCGWQKGAMFNYKSLNSFIQNVSWAVYLFRFLWGGGRGVLRSRKTDMISDKYETEIGGFGFNFRF